jgi:hypothetical protein
MVYIFLDESGVSRGFDEKSSKTFNIAIVTIDDQEAIKRVVRAFNKKVIRAGWPREVEIKASELFRAKNNRKIPESFKYKYNSYVLLKEFLQKLSCCKLDIDYITVKKSGIYPHLQEAPYGILYNYFASKILIPKIDRFTEVLVRADQRNKEQHTMLKFEGYIETEAYLNILHSFKLKIEHCDSRLVYGVRVADFVSWAIFRKYESDDSRFFDLITSKICDRQEWFYKKIEVLPAE